VIVLSVTCFCPVVVGQTAPHTTTHRDCCGLKDGSVDSLALLTLGVE
jgi:hypothetical protein